MRFPHLSFNVDKAGQINTVKTSHRLKETGTKNMERSDKRVNRGAAAVDDMGTMMCFF